MFAKDMSLSKLALAAMMAVGATARPVDSAAALAQREEDTCFKVHVINSCTEAKNFGVYKIDRTTAPWSTYNVIPAHTVQPGNNHTFSPLYKDVGLRLAMNEDQWVAQSLFEFGYSEMSYGGGAPIAGTAYDISMMNANDVGISVTPHNKKCERKKCTNIGCFLGEAWKAATDVAYGSPADTVCYEGKTDFTVEYCPS